MAKRHGEGTKMSAILKDFITTNRLEKGLDSVTIKQAWENVMGKAIVKYTTQIRLQNDVLYVSLSSSVLREELSYGKEKIIAYLNEEVGKNIVTKLILC